MPALALVPYLRPYFGSICFAGQTGGVEEILSTEMGLPFLGAEAIKFDRRRIWRNLAIPRVLSHAAEQMRVRLQQVGCGMVFSKGGYCALPTVLAAHRLGIPIVCHESDRTLGLANRLTLRYTSHLLTSFDTTPRGQCLGNPLRDAIFEGDPAGVPLPMSARPMVLVTGGSMGSMALNEAAVALARLRRDWDVVDLYGKSYVPCALKNFYGVPFASDMADYYARADVVVCRAGANTLFELAALGKRAVVVPLPRGVSRGDQVQNARYFAERYAFDVIEQDALSAEKLSAAIEYALSRESVAREYHNPNARIAQYIYEVYAGKR